MSDPSAFDTCSARVLRADAAESQRVPLDRRLARTLSARARAAGRTVVFLPARELRAALAALETLPADALVEIETLPPRVAGIVLVESVEDRLCQLAGADRRVLHASVTGSETRATR